MITCNVATTRTTILHYSIGRRGGPATNPTLDRGKFPRLDGVIQIFQRPGGNFPDWAILLLTRGKEGSRGRSRRRPSPPSLSHRHVRAMWSIHPDPGLTTMTSSPPPPPSPGGIPGNGERARGGGPDRVSAYVVTRRSFGVFPLVPPNPVGVLPLVPPNPTDP